MIAFTILGQSYSLKNTRDIFPIKAEKGAKCPHCRRPLRMITVPNEKAKLFEVEFRRQLPSSARVNLDGPFSADIVIYYPTNLQDLDEALVLDLCQRYGVITNDRNLVAKYVEKFIDKNNPRVEVRIDPVTWNRDGRQMGLLDDGAVKPERISA